jgi:hypothetical protein
LITHLPAAGRDSQKMIAQIIRDFWAFSEISLKDLDEAGIL